MRFLIYNVEKYIHKCMSSFVSIKNLGRELEH